MVINVTDEQIIKAHIGELSKIFDSTEKESQATNITSLGAYQTLLEANENANKKLRAEVERLQLKVEVIQEAKEQLEKDVFNAEMNLDGKDVEIMNLKHEIERLHKLQKPTEASGYKIENGKVVFYTNMLNGYRHEYANLDEVAKDLNLMLQNGYTSDEVISHYKSKLQTAKSEAIKEFAEMYERVIEQLLTSSTIEQAYVIYKCWDKFKALSYREYTKTCNEIPKKLEEMVGDDND